MSSFDVTPLSERIGRLLDEAGHEMVLVELDGVASLIGEIHLAQDLDLKQKEVLRQVLDFIVARRAAHGGER